MDLFTAFGPVFGSGLFAAAHSEAIEGSADDMVPHAREVTDTSASDHDDRVFLEVMAFAADVGGDFLSI